MALWIYSEDQSVLLEAADAIDASESTMIRLGQEIKARAEAEKANEVLRMLIRDLEADIRLWKALEAVREMPDVLQHAHSDTPRSAPTGGHTDVTCCQVRTTHCGHARCPLPEAEL